MLRKGISSGLLVILFFLGACTAPAKKPLPLNAATLRPQLAALPGVEMGNGAELTITYPGEVLFAEGAALPFPGGTEILQPLVDFMAAQPLLHWTAMVRVSGGASAEQDRMLAVKRGELLARYFARRGIGKEKLLLTAVVAEGAPLQLTIELPLAPAMEEE